MILFFFLFFFFSPRFCKFFFSPVLFGYAFSCLVCFFSSSIIVFPVRSRHAEVAIFRLYLIFLSFFILLFPFFFSSSITVPAPCLTNFFLLSLVSPPSSTAHLSVYIIIFFSFQTFKPFFILFFTSSCLFQRPVSFFSLKSFSVHYKAVPSPLHNTEPSTTKLRLGKTSQDETEPKRSEPSRESNQHKLISSSLNRLSALTFPVTSINNTFTPHCLWFMGNFTFL